MPRPKTKEELLSLGKTNFERLLALIDAIPEAKRMSEFPEGMLNRNVRDVLAHLHHWHIMMLSWYEVGMSGEKPDMPAKGYTWKTVPQLNREIQRKYAEMPLHKVKAMILESYKEIQQLISRHSNDELFEKKRYFWTGSTSLGSYLISATSSHYDWGYKLIKKALI